MSTSGRRWTEVRAVAYGASALGCLLALASYSPLDPSLNTVASLDQPGNLMGRVGSYAADVLFQTFGLAAFLLPAVLALLAYTRMRREELDSPAAKSVGLGLFAASLMTALSLPGLLRHRPVWHWRDLQIGGVLGDLLARGILHMWNLTGTIVLLLLAFTGSFYLLTTFSIAGAREWFASLFEWAPSTPQWWQDWREQRAERRNARGNTRRQEQIEAENARGRKLADEAKAAKRSLFPVVTVRLRTSKAEPEPVHEPEAEPEPEPEYDMDPAYDAEEELDAISRAEMDEPPMPAPTLAPAVAEIPVAPPPPPQVAVKPKVFGKSQTYRLPSTALLREPDGRHALDEDQLKDLAHRLQSKFAEFGVMGHVTQINPGPVVTTFEFKPEAGIKYSRVISLEEDLCLAMAAESILIERIPGKSTVGIEVPNVKRETIFLREMMESREFDQSGSKLTLALGKDISGHLRVAELNAMPHLLMAGSTGTGKSVCLNSFLVSMLYKCTPEDVRFILVDPKRLELGLYDGIPHLLVPIITEPKLAATALKNAVKEMERRLRLLAEKGVRHIEQYNRVIEKPRTLNLFSADGTPAADKEPETKLPYIVIIIDELADLMIVDSSNVETSITRLAQMARAVGIHLILATQRPSVDVITGLIKANFPARISFRVATKVDSRTILDANGSESLLGKGDMLYLPAGSGRLLRVHGPLVTEDEINGVVEFWRAQSRPNYETQYLAPPPREDDDEDAGEDGYTAEDDPMYEEAVRVVVEAGKASTSTLQRRLRLGYGRAARLLDIMENDGIIGPPDGSKPREVLKRPDWLAEVDDQLR